MSVSISPYPRFKAFYPASGNPLSGGQLWTLQPGTSGYGYLKATYTDSTGLTANTNPVILDANGEADVWLSGYTKLVLQDANANLIWTKDNVSSSPAWGAGQGQWVSQAGLPLAYVNSAQFTTPGNQTSVFQVNSRVQAIVSAGAITGTITASSSGGSPLATTVTVTWDSGQLDSSLSAISTGIITASSNALPTNIAAATAATATGLSNPFALMDTALHGIVVCNAPAHPTYQLSVATPLASFTVDITVVGAVNGLDTGAKANNTWYYLYMISNGTTIGGLLSASGTSPTLPSGYIFSKLIGAIYVNSGGTFITINQQANRVSIAPTEVVTAQNPTTATAVVMSAAVPTTAIAAWGYFSAPSSYTSYLAPWASGTSGLGTVEAVGSATIPFWLPVVSQALYYWVSGSSGSISVWVSGFEL